MLSAVCYAWLISIHSLTRSYTHRVFLCFLSLQDNGLTPLMLAARDNKHNIVEKLLELGAVVTDRDKVI